MKRLLLLCFAFIFFAFRSFSQKGGDAYIFSNNYVNIKPFNPFTDKIDNPDNGIYLAKRGQIFSISKPVTINGQKGYYIEFWRFKKDGTQIPPPTALRGLDPTYYIDSASSINKVFFIGADDLQAAAVPYIRPSWVTVDAVVLPIKLRFKNSQPNGDFSFEQSISIGPAVAIKKNIGGFFSSDSWSVVFGCNVTNINIDSTTAPKAVTSKTTVLGITPFVGGTLAFKNVNFSLMTGLDILTGKANSTWVYRKSPWLGFSVGVSIFQAKTKTAATDNQKSPD
jgi:hypothetical protein